MLAGARRRVLTATLVLAACVVAAALDSAPWPASLGWLAVLLVPLLLPLRGILRGERRTYAWATLCVAPYFIYGVTEVLANPAVRVAAAAILFASLAWFASLVDYLRRSRPAATSAQDAPGA